jgi:hypothetical protein
MSGFDSFINDHFALRDNWVELKARLTTLTGSRDNNGVFLGNDCLIENINPPDSTIYKANVQAINEYAAQVGKQVYLMPVPTAAEVESSKLPAYASTWDQSAYIKEIGSELKGVTLLDMTDTLKAHSDEYIYYRTDHHWTSLGAFYAYTAASSAMGYQPLEISDFTVQKATDSFDGTLYSKSGFRTITPDEIDFYHPKTGDIIKKLEIGSGKAAKTYNSIYFYDFLSKKDKYSSFFDGNQPIETVYTKTDNNKKLLVIKDSYAHSLVPFLMNNYSEITMVDLRYLSGNIDYVINPKDYDQTLFIYNVDTFNTDSSIQYVNP